MRNSSLTNIVLFLFFGPMFWYVWSDSKSVDLVRWFTARGLPPTLGGRTVLLWGLVQCGVVWWALFGREKKITSESAGPISREPRVVAIGELLTGIVLRGTVASGLTAIILEATGYTIRGASARFTSPIEDTLYWIVLAAVGIFESSMTYRRRSRMLPAREVPHLGNTRNNE
jgi:hypothetical protein